MQGLGAGWQALGNMNVPSPMSYAGEALKTLRNTWYSELYHSINLLLESSSSPIIGQVSNAAIASGALGTGATQMLLACNNLDGLNASGPKVRDRWIEKCTGVSFIDSTPLRACHIRREKQNKVFKELATKGQCSIGWFFGFKLHLIINDKGEILNFMLTQGNVDDREPLKNSSFHKKVFGKLVGDKGYLSQTLFEQLFIDRIHLITKIRNNMKNSLMQIKDKIILRKRALIETVNDELKNMCQVEHTRHRSFDNFITNLLSGLIAYSFFPKKPPLDIEIIDNKRINKVN